MDYTPPTTSFKNPHPKIGVSSLSTAGKWLSGTLTGKSALVGLDLQHVSEGNDLKAFFLKLRNLLGQNIQRVLPIMSDSDRGASLPRDLSELHKLGFNGCDGVVVIKKNTAIQKWQSYRMTNFRSDGFRSSVAIKKEQAFPFQLLQNDRQ